ncbi:MAG: hypothetical protein Q8L27_04370, partial [archaeon]|nr:hypothetical protein [archaeon]
NFIKNNKNIIIKFIQTGKIDYSELNGEIRKISYPLLIVRKLDINNINKLPLFILHNYEINLYNLLYDKRYLSLVGYSIALLVYSLLENKHFIFNRLMKDIKRNDEYIKNF